MGTKEVIIDAAKKRFLERGFHGTSMRDITNASGVSQGGIYSYFASKEELFKGVLNEAIPFESFLENAKPILEEEDPEIFFKKLAKSFLKCYKIENMKLRMIDFLEFKGKYFHILFKERIKEKPDLMTNKLEKFIKEGKIKEMKAQTLFLSFVMSVFSYLFIKSYIMEKEPVEKELLDSIDIFLYGSLIKKERLV